MARRAAVVTGAESGIGRATSIALADAGYDIGFTWLRSEEAANRLVSDVRDRGGRVAHVRLDLAEPEAGAEAVTALAQELDGLDALVNNAATGYSAPFIEMPLADWRRVLEINLTGAFCCAQAAARLMIKNQRAGCVVNVTSVQDTFPVRDSAAYGAAKGGLRQLTRVMAVELGGYGIRVNAVAPGEINTMMTGREGVPGSAVARPETPLGRAGSADEVAAAIAWLVSDAASYVTGATFIVDGGCTLMGPALASRPPADA